MLCVCGKVCPRSGYHGAYEEVESCFLTEKNSTFWEGRSVDHTRWCFVLAPVFWASLWQTWCCTHSTYKKWGTCHCHLGMKIYASWNYAQNLLLCYQWANALSKEENSWLIDDSDVSNAWVFSGNFNLEQSHESRFGFLQPHTIVCEDGWWDWCKLIRKNISHIDVAATGQQCSHHLAGNIQVKHLEFSKMEGFVYFCHVFDFLGDSIVTTLRTGIF